MTKLTELHLKKGFVIPAFPFIKNNPNKAIMTALSWLYRRAVMKDFNWSSLKVLPKPCSRIAPTIIAVKPKKAPKKRIIICSSKKSCLFS